MASLSLKHINKVYPNGFEAVKDFNLEKMCIRDSIITEECEGLQQR